MSNLFYFIFLYKQFEMKQELKVVENLCSGESFSLTPSLTGFYSLN